MAHPVSPSKNISPQTLELFKDSIRRIKSQKQRPGFERIAQTLKTHHSLTNVHEIKQYLDIAIRDGLLLPVWTKGLECYKDPENLKSLRKFIIQTPADVRRAVKAAVREIGDPLGSKVPTITNYVRYSFGCKIPDLDGAIVLAVEVLAKKTDLIKVQERFRSCHIAPPDGANSTASERVATLLDTSSSALLDAEDDFDAVNPSRSLSSTCTVKSANKRNTAPGTTIKGSRTNVDQLHQMEVDHYAQAKLAPRRFYKFQCWCCRFFSTMEDDFLKHVSGRTHADRTMKKIIYCNSCQFRTRDRKKLAQHLKKHKCHNDGGHGPVCLLTFGLFTSLTLTE